jgi:predicted TPR repeat methyltransferase
LTAEYRDLIAYSNQFAHDYDGLARQSEWFGGDALFGMMYEYLRPGVGLLDMGIGTGLASRLFHRAGLKVTGIDLSEPMLEKCRAKGIAIELRVGDLREPLPFGDCRFHHAIAVGVFHFIKEVEPLIQEASRVLRQGGMFGCTTFCPEDESRDLSEKQVEGFTVYQHSDRHIQTILKEEGFSIVKTTRFSYYSDPSKGHEVTNRIYVARNRDST